MVRAIVGTLLWVARGKVGAEEMERIVGSRDRTKAGPSAPARGLCLVAVSYDGTSRSGEGRDDDDE
jgi:tRNA pseudouridine38-40 synthase